MTDIFIYRQGTKLNEEESQGTATIQNFLTLFSLSA